jgi:hypothetical protein
MVGGAIEWVRFLVQGVADRDSQWRNPLWVVGRVVDLPRQIDEAAKVSRRVDGDDLE